MILFELYRQLDVRLYQTMEKIDKNYGAVGKYILQDDSFILLGYDHSVRINMMSRELTPDVAMRSFELETEPVLWFSEDSTEGCIIRMISCAMRQWLGVDSVQNGELYATLEETNRLLFRYNLRIMFDMDSMCIFYDGEAMTFEQALEHVMEMDSEAETGAFLPEWFSEAEYLRRCGNLEEACERYEKVLKHTNRSQPIYTTSAFHLAECYYFLGNYDRAVKLYYRCNMEFITDENDFYLHLGHALLDEKMKKYERQIKVYYHCKIDAEYALNHKQAMEAAGNEVADVFEEYEKTCQDMGLKKYNEHRAHLPDDADDIDEIMAFDFDTPDDRNIAPKRYEGITLIDQSFQSDIKNKTVNELLADALDDYMSGEYQEAYSIYRRLLEEVAEGTDYHTWILFQIGKLYTITGEFEKASEVLAKCDPNSFGLVYRLDDYLVLYAHVRIVCDDFESNPYYRNLIRGRIDFYYAKYDRIYNNLITDGQLMSGYEKYETECFDNSATLLSEKISSEVLEKGRRQKNSPPLLKGLFKFFSEKK